MNALSLAILGALMILILVANVWLAARSGETRRKLDGLSGELARVMARIEAFEKQLNGSWQGVETRVGRIHETFETGRACRMGTTIIDVDVKMGQLNRKIEELIARMPRGAQEVQAP